MLKSHCISPLVLCLVTSFAHLPLGCWPFWPLSWIANGIVIINPFLQVRRLKHRNYNRQGNQNSKSHSWSIRMLLGVYEILRAGEWLGEFHSYHQGREGTLPPRFPKTLRSDSSPKLQYGFYFLLCFVLNRIYRSYQQSSNIWTLPVNQTSDLASNDILPVVGRTRVESCFMTH